METPLTKIDLADAWQVFTPENCRLISLIYTSRPASVKALCELSQRSQPNVSRALSLLVKSGVVRLIGSRPKRPELTSLSISIEMERRQAA